MFENSWLEDEIFYFISQKYVQSFDRICSFIMYFLVVGFHSEHYLTFSSQNNSFRIISLVLVMHSHADMWLFSSGGYFCGPFFFFWKQR